MTYVEKESANDYYIMMAKCMIRMLQDIGFTLKKNMRILDFGCGNGDLVQAFSSLGYDIYGVDIIDCPSLDASHYKKIGFNPYQIPFSEDSFDLVYSSSVFEHTQNTEECFREIYRVLKPGGATINALPSRYRILESHIHVPFGGFIQSPMWLKLWAILGIRNEFQQGLSWKEVYQRNIGYCKTGINYHSYKDLKKMILSIFGNIKVVKKEYIKNMPGGAAKIGRLFPIPGYGNLIFFFRQWELFMVKDS